MQNEYSYYTATEATEITIDEDFKRILPKLEDLYESF